MVGYLVETPIWKASYRLVLPELGSNEGLLQGWAIVENQTDNDWEGIELSLVSGRPISFIQDLYQPLYLPRPTVQPDLQASLRPQTYAGGLGYLAGDDEKARESLSFGISAGRGIGGDDYAAQSDAVMLAEQPSPVLPAAEPDNFNRYYAQRPQLAEVSRFETQATGAEVGELFRFTVADVTLPRQRSAMIPIVNDPIEVDRLSIFNANVHATHPLNGARLTNTSGNHLLQGPLTVFDENTYAGDAQIETIPPGQERLLSYALDLDTRVQTEQVRDDDTYQTLKLIRGALEITSKRVREKEYRIANQGDRDRTLLVEHPLEPLWDLISPEKANEQTDSLYRFEVPVAASDTETLTVKEEMLQTRTFAMLSVDPNEMVFYVDHLDLSPEVKQALQKVIDWKGEIALADREIEAHRQRIQEITQEQERIRSNLTTVRDQTSSYYTRLLKKLDEQETELEEIRMSIEDLEEKRDETQKTMEDFLRDLEVE
jgi:hypothetical protein